VRHLLLCVKRFRNNSFASVLDAPPRIANNRRMKRETLIGAVRRKLAPLCGSGLYKLAAEMGLSYDTLLRIRDGNTDPRYSTVQRLADRFGVDRRARKVVCDGRG
jgi:transcriptional regulator with XRE-family HTH domain